jgi:hypothetical protein
VEGMFSLEEKIFFRNGKKVSSFEVLFYKKIFTKIIQIFQSKKTYFSGRKKVLRYY